MKNKWKEYLYQMAAAFGRFMYLRNGMDELSCLILVISMLLGFVSGITRQPVVTALYCLGILLACFRFFSKNRMKRQKENQALLFCLTRIASFFKIRRQILSERKTHRYYRCPQCRQWLRVPRGRGRIEIRCIKCQKTFLRES